MTQLVLWMVLAWGVDAGYEPAPDGHLEYIIQIEPQLLGSLAAGHDVTSEVPHGLDVRHYRLSVGTAALPRIAAAPAGGQASTAGRGSSRAADQFETRGRVDEAIGATTPQIRVGYQATSATGGRYVIEIDARSLADLNQADLTGDIPPGLPVTRFVISTNPGSAPGEMPNGSGRASLAPTTAAMPAMVGAGPAAVDEDPSSWQAETPPATAGGPPASSGSSPTLTTVPPVTDDAPGGDVAPPAAMPPHRNTTEEPSGPSSSGRADGDPPGGTFHHKGSGAGRAADRGQPTDNYPAAETSPGLGAAPGQLPLETASGPLVTPTAGVDEAESESRKKPSAATEGEGDEKAPSQRSSESKETAPLKPWLPFTLAVFGLIASLGLNVFLGWIVWDSYNRGRGADDKFVGGKTSLSS